MEEAGSITAAETTAQGAGEGMVKPGTEKDHKTWGVVREGRRDRGVQAPTTLKSLKCVVWPSALLQMPASKVVGYTLHFHTEANSSHNFSVLFDSGH